MKKKNSVEMKYNELLADLLNKVVKEDGTLDKSVLAQIDELSTNKKKLDKLSEEVKKTKTERVTGIVNTGFNGLKTVAGIATPFLLTLICFGYESEGNGNIFTTTGRTTISNVLRNQKND